ncbi:hypothetical protein ACJH6J_03820 [Mycobacterium sp. SMC-18]
MTAGDIAVDSLTVRYPGAGRPVVDGLDLTIESGAFLAVLGTCRWPSPS